MEKIAVKEPAFVKVPPPEMTPERVTCPLPVPSSVTPVKPGNHRSTRVHYRIDEVHALIGRKPRKES